MDERILVIACLEFAESEHRPGRPKRWCQLDRSPESGDGVSVLIGVVVKRPQIKPAFTPLRIELYGLAVEFDRLLRMVGLAGRVSSLRQLFECFARSAALGGGGS